uniref:PCI domain-containing protein n=1 Tax=Caenorhabditis tropicalis TaxID=1561998 RepID=A0A1I7TXJ1_9PELO
MDPPPFNFNTASTSGKTQPAPSAFGTTAPKYTFGSSFGKPSVLAQAVKREGEKPPEPNNIGGLSSSSSLAGRITVAPKNKNSIFKGNGDSADDKVPNLQEGQFAIRPLEKRKVPVGPYTRFGKREPTPEGTEKKPKFNFQIGKQTTEPPKSFFLKQKANIADEGKDETDHAIKKEPAPSLFGVTLAPSTSSKGIGSLFTTSEKSGPAPKPYGDRVWKASNRASPAPDIRPNKSNSEEGKLIQKLVSLKGQRCLEDYDKYQLLDERDKILCQLREIDSPLIRRLERCEEMCTEKERYQRIVQKGVSPFECDVETGNVSHDMMVKQYARSAADQERPLPHELRSEKIMNQVMCYLLHNVLDDFPESHEDRAAWYNFLWNRTRALRKEVTQLSLSDSLALNLVERCTRLHVLFGYVLCDLETEHFDAAMNNETLGKCLQTLRHLYEDFEKRGIPCENEAEFRSYDVMLHMNDTNVLSQVLSYRIEVRQSQPVRLALQLASSFRDKNYCRFFRLLKNEASFLQCCVAHKLFAATRSNAISIMANSYGRSTLPLDRLQNILAYDTIEDLTVMLNIYGLRTEGSDDVMLSKDDLTLNVVVPLTTYEWIDKKSQGKFSNVVYGPNLFQFIASRCDVSNSFNHHSEYVNDKVLETVLSGSDIPTTSNGFGFSQSAGSLSIQATIEQRNKQEAERQKRIEEAQREKLIEKLMTGVIDQIVHKIAEDEVNRAIIVRKQMIAFEKAKKQKEEQELLKKEMMLKKQEKEKEVARNLVMKIEREVAERELKRIAEEEIKKERQKRERKLAHSIVEKCWKDVLQSVDNHVKRICEEMVEEQKQILNGLNTFRDRMAKQWLLQFWNRWRDWVALKKEAKLRKYEMIRRCVPKWESEEVANHLVKKYGGNKENTSPNGFPLNRPSNHIQLVIFKKNRQSRIVRTMFKRWRDNVKKLKAIRKLAEERQKRENEFFQRFTNDARVETRFKFNAPDDIMKVKRRKSDTFKEKESKFDYHNMSFQDLDTSLSVARRHLVNWEPATELPDDLKEKLKRKRESFEKTCEVHLLKKKKDEKSFIEDAKTNNLQIKK